MSPTLPPLSRCPHAHISAFKCRLCWRKGKPKLCAELALSSEGRHRPMKIKAAFSLSHSQSPPISMCWGLVAGVQAGTEAPGWVCVLRSQGLSKTSSNGVSTGTMSLSGLQLQVWALFSCCIHTALAHVGSPALLTQ